MKLNTARKSTIWLPLMAACLSILMSACSSDSGGSSAGGVGTGYTQLAACGDDESCASQASEDLRAAIQGCLEDAVACKSAADGGSDRQICRDELHACLEANRPPLPPCLAQLQTCVSGGGDARECIQQARQCIRDEIAGWHDDDDEDGGIDEDDEQNQGDDDGGCDRGKGFGGWSKGSRWRH